MSMTNAQKRKQSKKKARDKKRQKSTNIRHNNLGPERWVLQVLLDGVWREARKFRTWKSVEGHKEETERRRKLGEEIIPGKVFSLETGKEVLSIAGSGKEAVPDKMAGNEKAADKAKPGFLKRMMGHGDSAQES